MKTVLVVIYTVVLTLCAVVFLSYLIVDGNFNAGYFSASCGWFCALVATVNSD
jgi:hypothetical protein